jgi:hypothetical protein
LIDTPVKSSGAEPYAVTVGEVEGITTLTCDCQAGSRRQLCKHKIAIIEGDLYFAVEGSEDLFQMAYSAVQASGIPALGETQGDPVTVLLFERSVCRCYYLEETQGETQ